MFTIVLLCLLVGLVLGHRFKVLVLVPATAMILLAAGVTAIVNPHHWSLAVIAVAAAAALQVGYVAGYGIHRILTVAPQRRMPLSLSPSQPEQRNAVTRLPHGV
jgi:hypothetical protein